MSTQVQRRRGTTVQHESFTGAAGELTIDTTKQTVVVHNGVTPGGTPLAKESHTHAEGTDTAPGMLEVATDAEIRSNAVANRALVTDKIWSAASPVNLGSVTGSITLNFGNFLNARATQTGNVTLNAVSGLKPGQTAVIEFFQDGTGGRTISLNSSVFLTAGSISIATTANARNVLVLYGLSDGKAMVVVSGKGIA
ncbi:hypothetical protein [Aquibium microcysteis]|uniref:hyaluronate lyase N-terminal domain-containing protein n=1 Tax=Aquibium microcysteis TaxID=675281 RepID=UPI00165D02A4|nr:hypothetical protein [Aquibium microcysteis]